MNIGVVITCGALTYDIQATDTGPDGMAQVIHEATVNFLTLASTEAGKAAVAAGAVSDAEE